MFEPELWLGVSLTIAVFLFGYFAWDSMKNYVSAYVERELYERERELRQEMTEGFDRQDRQWDRMFEDTERNLREVERDVYDSIEKNAVV